MSIDSQQRKVVEDLFRAMQAGPGGENAMMALFADDAVFVEPFSGQPQTHTGTAAIRQSFRDQWKDPLPDLELTLDRVDLDEGRTAGGMDVHVAGVPDPDAGIRSVHAQCGWQDPPPRDRRHRRTGDGALTP